MRPTAKPNIGSYEERLGAPSWPAAEAELGYTPGSDINIGWYCADRICEQGQGARAALIWESLSGGKTFTFNDLRLASNSAAAFLRGLGVGREDRVCLLLDRIPELYFAFLGILKAGAVAQPLFSSFGEEALLSRLGDARTSVVITQRRHLAVLRGLRARLPALSRVVVVDDDGGQAPAEGEIPFSLEKYGPVEEFRCAATRAESPSVLHYTSGTTGAPKGVCHAHYSLISQYLTAKWVLDLRGDDVYWCTADPAWVTGTSYGIIGPWSLGVTQCVLHAGFTAENWYRFIQKHRVTVWYTAPTAVRALMAAGEGAAKAHDLSSLRHLASVGEPLNPEAVGWSGRVYGVPFRDTYWQTETGSIMIANHPGSAIKPGSMGKPFPGITAGLLDPRTFEPLAGAGRAGLLAFRPDWPARMRGYWGNEEFSRLKFRGGWYLTGDRASRDGDGCYWFAGREDDIINTGGHLVSPCEVEAVLLLHPAVAEAAVVSVPDPVRMEAVKAFVALKPGFSAGGSLSLEIMNFVRKKLSPQAMPQELEFLPLLPRTRSGKLMRSALKARARGAAGGGNPVTGEDEV